MKKNYLIILFFTIFFSVFLGEILSFRGGAPSGRTGSPLDTKTCKDSGCHNSFNVNSGNAAVSLTTNVPSTGWETGMTYEVTVSIEESGVTRFGFEAMAYGTTVMDGVGNATITDATRTKLNPGAVEYITHTSAGADNNDAAVWKFDWTAPAAGEGDIIFYSALNSTNANGNAAGDNIYTTTDTIRERTAMSLEGFASLENVRLFPTVASDKVFLELEVAAYTTVAIRVTDMAGRTVYSLEDDASAGMYSTEINVNSWDDGMYVVTLQSEGVVGYKKFLVK